MNVVTNLVVSLSLVNVKTVAAHFLLRSLETRCASDVGLNVCAFIITPFISASMIFCNNSKVYYCLFCSLISTFSHFAAEKKYSPPNIVFRKVCISLIARPVSPAFPCFLSLILETWDNTESLCGKNDFELKSP